MIAPGTTALWHRPRENKPPRPVFVVQRLRLKFLVLDLCESTALRPVFRRVMPGSLTERRAA